MPTDLIGAGLSLIGGAALADSADRANGRAITEAQNNRGFIQSQIPTGGFEVRAGTSGPSFVFGGQTGRVIVAPNNPNATSGEIRIGDINSTRGEGVFVDQATGRVFDGTTGEVIENAQVIAPGGSFTNIQTPDFSGISASTDAARANLAAAGGNASALDGIAAELQGLGADFQEQLGGNANDLLDLADQVGGLLPRVAEGASEIREARNNQLNDAELSARSNLRDQLGQRRIAGSSFAADAESRQRAEFGRQRAEADALSTLEEISTTTQLLTLQTNIVDRAGERLNQGLQGNLSALQSAAQSEAAAGNLRLGIAQGEIAAGQLDLATLQADFQSQIDALSLALGGQQAAQGFITDMTRNLTAANGQVVGALNERAGTRAGLASGLFSIGGSLLSAPTVPTQAKER